MYAGWESCNWEGKELYHTADFLVNCYIFSSLIIQNHEVIALSLWKTFQKEIKIESLRRKGDG